jgi:hypothetical protein
VLSLAEALAALPGTANGIAAHLREQGIRGVRRAACRCPLTVYLTSLGFFRVSVGEIHIRAASDSASGDYVVTPGRIVEFTERFDSGEWPELVLVDAAEATDA